MEYFRRVVRGKGSKGVAVLLTTKVVHQIDLLLKCRNNFINPENKYLFPASTGDNPIQGTTYSNQGDC